MNLYKLTLNTLSALIVTTSVSLFSTISLADGHKVLDKIHFLIPGGAGGGWDGTARGTGEALTKSVLVGTTNAA